MIPSKLRTLVLSSPTLAFGKDKIKTRITIQIHNHNNLAFLSQIKHTNSRLKFNNFISLLKAWRSKEIIFLVSGWRRVPDLSEERLIRKRLAGYLFEERYYYYLSGFFKIAERGSGLTVNVFQ